MAVASRLTKGIIIGGPTGIGKTDLAVALAQRLGGELVSCDSVQIYTGLVIGANKTPTPVPQHLLDLIPWKTAFSAAEFVEKCWVVVNDIVKRGKVPILVGGTGFYLDWVIRGRPSAPPTDPTVLATVEADLKLDMDWETSWRRLEIIDPEYSRVILKNDYYRLKRALVVYRMTGLPLSSFKTRHNYDSLNMDWRCFYLTHTNRLALLRHLDARCEVMVQRGLVKEVISLKNEGFNSDYQAGRAIGYKETLDFLSKLETGVDPDRLVQDYLFDFQSQTRQYTRRQEKWFAAMSNFLWLERGDLLPGLSESLIEKAMQLYTMESSTCGGSSQHPLIVECQAVREMCRAPQVGKDRRKLFRTYQSTLTIYSDAIARGTLLNTQVYHPSKE